MRPAKVGSIAEMPRCPRRPPQNGRIFSLLRVRSRERHKRQDRSLNWDSPGRTEQGEQGEMGPFGASLSSVGWPR